MGTDTRHTETAPMWAVRRLNRLLRVRAFTAPAILLTLALTGCSGASPTAPLPATSSATLGGPGTNGADSTHPASPERPIKGHCEAETVEVTRISPTVIRRVAEGTCQFSHLGRTTQRSVLDTNLVTLEQVGQATFTAANGDLMYTTSSGTGTLTPPSTIHISGVATITGGTGRFADAVGVMQVSGTSDPSAGRTSLSFDGWITY